MFSRKSTRIWISLIAIGCFLLIGRNYLGQLDRISQASWIGIVAMVVVHLTTLSLQSQTIKWGLDSLDRPIGTCESIRLFVLSSYANLLLPRSGVGASAIYLNRSRQTSIADFGSVILFNTALFVSACSALGCFVVGADYLSGSTTPVWWMWGLPVLLAVSSISVLFKWKLPNWYRLPGKAFLGRFCDATSKLSGSKSALQIGVAHFVLALLRSLRLYIAFWALGFEVSFAAALFTSILGDLAFVVAITPGAIGFREAAIALAAIKLGVGVPEALSVAVFDRLVFSSTVVVVAQLFIAKFVGTKAKSPIAT